MSHVAVLLGNGKVLIAGGFDTAGTLASAILYDPITAAFTATGSMTHPRAHPTATKLTDGRVLIAGGWAGSSALGTAELYEPDSGTFSSTGSMHFARSDHSATLLADGRVLIAGGLGAAGTPASAELYDPDTGTFTLTGPLATGRNDHSATRLGNGKVLIAGGSSSSCGTYKACASAELYDPTAGTFSATGSMAHPRSSHTASVLPDGRVLIAGGLYGYGGVKAAEIYDPASGAFSATGSLLGTNGRFIHTATVLPDGRVAMIGGAATLSTAGGQGALQTVEVFNPATGTFTAGPSLVQGRSFHTSTLLADGHVLVVGGAVGETVLNSAELGWI